MRARRKWILLLIGLIILGTVVWNVMREREPVFEGRPLSAWLLYRPNPNTMGTSREEAIRRLGTNAIPYLLNWLYYSPPPWRAKAAYFVGRWLPQPFYSQWIVTTIGGYREIGLASAANEAFEILGPIAAPAIPELRAIALKSRHTNNRFAAVKALRAIGPEAKPALLAIYTNPADTLSVLTIVAGVLDASQNTNGYPRYQVVTNYFSHPDPLVRQGATNFARDFTPEFPPKRIRR